MQKNYLILFNDMPDKFRAQPSNIEKKKESSKPEGEAVGKSDQSEQTEQKEIKRTVKENYQIKDGEGKIICNVIAEFEIIEGEKEGRMLKTFVIEKDGKFIDIFELINLEKPITIYISNTENNFNYKEKTAKIPEPSRPFAIAIALHELGHAKQSESDLYDSMYKKFLNSPNAYTDPKKYFNNLKEIFPEASEYFPTDEQLKELKRLSNEIKDVDEQIEKYLDDGVYSEVITIETYKKLREQREEIEKKFNLKMNNFIALLDLPSRILERNATHWAFKWAREIQKIVGVDILSVSDNLFIENLGKSLFFCHKSPRSVIGNPQRFGGNTPRVLLLACLDTYDALDKIPPPILKRIKEL